MKNKKFTFADVTFELELPHGVTLKNGLDDFVSDREADYLIRVLLTDGESFPSKTVERNRNVITRYVHQKHGKELNTASLLATSEAAFLFPEHDAFILHASYILYDGRAILFTAPSGTGKSTQARFWSEERGAEIVNGDRVLVTKRNGCFYANGIYACGTSGICKNITAPIAAVVFLEQGECNMRNDIPARLLFLRILCECSYNMSDTVQYEKITELVSDMINTVPTVCYRCQKSPVAVSALERILWNRE